MSKLFDRQVHPDRPWAGRGYGRIRLDEPLAKDLAGIMYDVIQARVKELKEVKQTGGDTLPQRLALKRANALKERVHNLISEQGWGDGY